MYEALGLTPTSRWKYFKRILLPSHFRWTSSDFLHHFSSLYFEKGHWTWLGRLAGQWSTRSTCSTYLPLFPGSGVADTLSRACPFYGVEDKSSGPHISRTNTLLTEHLPSPLQFICFGFCGVWLTVFYFLFLFRQGFTLQSRLAQNPRPCLLSSQKLGLQVSASTSGCKEFSCVF